MIISEDYNNLPIVVYQKGSFFGEIEIFQNMKRCFTCVALEELELLVIEKSNYKKIFNRQFPFLGQMFLIQIEARWKHIEDILKLIDKFLDPQKKNKSGREITEAIIKEGKVISKMSRKNTISRKSK